MCERLVGDTNTEPCWGRRAVHRVHASGFCLRQSFRAQAVGPAMEEGVRQLLGFSVGVQAPRGGVSPAAPGTVPHT